MSTTHVSRSKEAIIGWWVCVVAAVVLAYRRVGVDIGYLIIAIVAAILFLLMFCSENGAEYNNNIVYTIASWLILSISIIVFANILDVNIAIAIIAIIILLAVMISLMYLITFPSAILLYVSCLLLVLVITISNWNNLTVYQLIVTLLFQIGALFVFTKGYIAESLLIMTISGIVIGMGYYISDSY